MKMFKYGRSFTFVCIKISYFDFSNPLSWVKKPNVRWAVATLIPDHPLPQTHYH